MAGASPTLPPTAAYGSGSSTDPGMSFLLACVLASSIQEPAKPPPQMSGTGSPQGRVTIEARDGLKLFAEHRPASDPSAPFIVLFHQARSSRGEYRPIVPRLTELGYGTLAVDLRVGGSSREVANVTARGAKGRVKDPTYLDALADIEDALLYAREHCAKGKLIAWGSSFSAALVLQLAGTRPELVDGVLAFSPGEYFASLGKGESWIRDAARGVRCPVFVTAARSEGEGWLAIFEAIGSEAKTAHRPEAGVQVGSMALWEESEGSAACWQALTGFLAQHFPPPRTEAKPGG